MKKTALALLALGIAMPVFAQQVHPTPHIPLQITNSTVQGAAKSHPAQALKYARPARHSADDYAPPAHAIFQHH
jgi:hypothetical protein